MAQIVEGERAEVLILFLGLFGDGLDQAAEVELAEALRRLLAAPGALRLASRRCQNSALVSSETGRPRQTSQPKSPAVDQVDDPQLVALADHGELAALAIEMGAVGLHQLVERAPVLRRR
jgi:hypothetical protein